jgi:hypothetical protein
MIRLTVPGANRKNEKKGVPFPFVRANPNSVFSQTMRKPMKAKALSVFLWCRQHAAKSLSHY